MRSADGNGPEIADLLGNARDRTLFFQGANDHEQRQEEEQGRPLHGMESILYLDVGDEQHRCGADEGDDDRLEMERRMEEERQNRPEQHREDERSPARVASEFCGRVQILQELGSRRIDA